MHKRKTLMRAIGGARRAWKQHVREIALSAGIPESYRTVLTVMANIFQTFSRAKASADRISEVLGSPDPIVNCI